jgi:hypothetical protein
LLGIVVVIGESFSCCAKAIFAGNNDNNNREQEDVSTTMLYNNLEFISLGAKIILFSLII